MSSPPSAPASPALPPASTGLLARARRALSAVRRADVASVVHDARDARAPIPATEALAAPAHPAAAGAAGAVAAASRAAPLDAQAREDWARWARAVAGDAGCADALVRELGRSGLRLAQQVLRSREAAEDAVQEALLRLWRCPPQDRGTARLSTWFAAVVLNICRDMLARDRRETSTDPELLNAWQDGAAPEGVLDPWSSSALDPGQRLDARASERRLAQAVAALPPRQRMAIALWAYAEASMADIARALDLDPNAAHQLLHRAKRTLRSRLQPPKDGVTTP